MKRPALALTMALIISFAFIGSMRLTLAQAGTSVNGIIFSDQTWTQTQSPYNVTGPLAIAKGATVTIRPGATVNLNTFTLQVNGTLTAIGTSSSPITINGGYRPRLPVFGSEDRIGEIDLTSEGNSWNEKTGTGSIIEYSIVSSLSISIENISLMFRNNNFGAYSSNGVGGGINLVSSNSTIENNNLWAASISVADGSPILSENTIQGKYGPYGTAIEIDGGSPKVNNNLLYWGGIGIAVSTAAHTTISNNIIANYSSGISGGSGNYTIENNLLIYTSNGLTLSYTDSSPIVTDNTIAFSQDSITSAAPNAIINYNNIENYSQNSIRLSSSGDMNASNNWWGTTDSAAISQSIYDYKNDYNLGNVTFTPFLTSPVSEAPSISSFNPPIAPNSLPTQTAPAPTQTTQPNTSPNQPSQSNPPPKATPATTPLNPAGPSAPTQNQLYEVIAVLVIVIIGLIAALAVAMRHRDPRK